MLRSAYNLIIGLLLATTAATAAADDFIKSDYGAPLKVIVRHDAAIFSEPTRDSDSQPVHQFEFYFVVPSDDSASKTTDNFYRVATRKSTSSAVGWIHQDDVIEWPHLQVLGFKLSADRDLAEFFATKQDVHQYVESGDASRAISREPEGVEVLSLLPILKEESLTVDEEVIGVYETAYLHSRDPRNVFTATPEGVTAKQIQNELTLDVAFVIDTTKSMQPYIDSAKAVVRDVSAAVKDSQDVEGRVRLALVGYRDIGDEYTTKVLCSFESGKDLSVFQSHLSDTVADGGGDYPEQVFAGVHTAVTELNWNDLSNRHVVLIGDAPSHTEESLISLDQVLASAQPTATTGDRQAQLQQITLHTLRVGGAEGLANAEFGRQFGALAAGRDHAGHAGSAGTTEAFVGDLVNLMRRRVGDTESAIRGEAITDPNAGAIGAVLTDLRAEASIGATFSSGYVAEVDARGNRAVEPFVLVGRSDLRTFNSAVDYCVTSLERIDGESQGQRTLTRYQIKDLQQEAIVPSGDLLLPFDAVLGGVLLQEADRQAA